MLRSEMGRITRLRPQNHLPKSALLFASPFDWLLETLYRQGNLSEKEVFVRTAFRSEKSSVVPVQVAENLLHE